MSGLKDRLLKVINPRKEADIRMKRALSAFYASPRLKKYLEDVVNYGLIIEAMHLYGISLSLTALKELEVDKTLKRPSSVAEIAYYHDIAHTDLLRTILDLLSVHGILLRSGGRYLLNPTRREWKVRYPQKVLEIMEKPLYREIFDTMKLFGDQLLDVLLTGEPALDYEKDAVTALEPIILSLPFTLMRLWAISEGFYTLWIKMLGKKKRANILVFNSEAGYAIQNIFDMFGGWDITVYAVDSSPRQTRLAQTLVDERGLNAIVINADYTRDITKIQEIRDVVDEEGGFDLALSFNVWYWIDDKEKEKVIANVASVLKPEGITVDLSFVRKTADRPYGWEPVFYVVSKWVGIPAIQLRRKLYITYFERLKEKRSSQIVKAEAPVEREVIVT